MTGSAAALPFKRFAGRTAAPWSSSSSLDDSSSASSSSTTSAAAASARARRFAWEGIYGASTSVAVTKLRARFDLPVHAPVAMSLSAALYGLQHSPRRCRGAGAQQQQRRLGGAQRQSTRPRAAVDTPPPPRRDKTVAMPRRKNGDTEPSVPPTPRCAQGVLSYTQVPVPKSYWPV